MAAYQLEVQLWDRVEEGEVRDVKVPPCSVLGKRLARLSCTETFATPQMWMSSIERASQATEKLRSCASLRPHRPCRHSAGCKHTLHRIPRTSKL